jgi:hypothetical protein
MTEFAWHVHHGILIEPLTEPIEVRQRYIREHKPKHEQELRLRLLTKVKGELPAEATKAVEAFDKARIAYNVAWAEVTKATTAYTKARDALALVGQNHKEEIEKLHRQECPDCPWNGRSIFPEEVTQ